MMIYDAEEQRHITIRNCSHVLYPLGSSVCALGDVPDASNRGRGD